MILLLEEAARFQRFVISNGWEFYFVGGLAVQIWGEPRLTRDIDLHIFTNLKNEPAFIETILAQYEPKVSGVEEFALTERILPVLTENGITIDITLSGDSDLSESLVRSSYQPFSDDISLKVCSPDDLLILKTLAGRSRDWPDIESVLIKQTELDWDYIGKSIRDLFEYEPDLPQKYERLTDLRMQYYRP